LWARDDSTGELYSYPISLVDNQPTLSPGSLGTPVAATSGTRIGGISLPASAYPAVVSSGPLGSQASFVGDLSTKVSQIS